MVQRLREREAGAARVPPAACRQARSAISCACGATPAMPTPLPALAPMMPATAVPCDSAAAGRAPAKSCCAASRPSRSGWRAVHAGVDHRHAHVAPGGHAVQIVQLPARGGRLGGVERVRPGRLQSIHVHRLRPRHAAVGRQRLRRRFERALGRHRHHVAVQAEQRHGPVVRQRQAMQAGKVLCHAAPCLACHRVAIGAGIGAVGAEVIGRHRQQHEHLPGGVVLDALPGGRCRKQGGNDQQPRDEAPHRGPSPPSDSASSTCGSARNRAIAQASWPAGTASR